MIFSSQRIMIIWDLGIYVKGKDLMCKFSENYVKYVWVGKAAARPHKLHTRILSHTHTNMHVGLKDKVYMDFDVR